VQACQFGAADGLTYGTQGGVAGYQWTAVSAIPGSVAAAGEYVSPNQLSEGGGQTPSHVPQPVIVQGGCGGVNQIEFERPDPLQPDQSPADQTSQTLVPADPTATMGAVAVSADNDAWAAAGAGQWIWTAAGGVSTAGAMSPHLYQYTDGQTPNAPAGNDDESRPSLFTVSPPVYQVISPTVIKAPTKTKTVKKKLRPKRVAPAIFAIRTKLQRGAHDKYTLHLFFRLRRPVTLGLEVLHGKRVVARTSLKRFRGTAGELSVSIERAHWPTSIKLLNPGVKRAAG
jgi:hypothetical protein